MSKSTEKNDDISGMAEGLKGNLAETGAFYNCLARYSELPSEYKELFLKEEDEKLQVKKHQVLKTGGRFDSDIYVLESGWACLFITSENDSREIVDIFLPGDIIGLRESFLTNENTKVVMLTDGKLVGMKYSALHALAQEKDDVNDAVLRFIIFHDNILIERLRSCTQNQAEKRVAHFLLEIHTRLSFSVNVSESYFNMPITQAVIGNLLGITSVHVSRCMASLEKRKLIRKKRNGVKILNASVMSHETGFDKDSVYKSFSLKGVSQNFGR